jgi:hypothetical protein
MGVNVTRLHRWMYEELAPTVMKGGIDKGVKSNVCGVERALASARGSDPAKL